MRKHLYLFQETEALEAPIEIYWNICKIAEGVGPSDREEGGEYCHVTIDSMHV
jgi:hypothetical protein